MVRGLQMIAVAAVILAFAGMFFFVVGGEGSCRGPTGHGGHLPCEDFPERGCAVLQIPGRQRRHCQILYPQELRWGDTGGF